MIELENKSTGDCHYIGYSDTRDHNGIPEVKVDEKWVPLTLFEWRHLFDK